MRQGDEGLVKKKWHEMLLAYKAFATDTSKYCARLKESAGEAGAHGDSLRFCAMFLVGISQLWDRAFYPVEVTAERQPLSHESDVWVGVINTSHRTSRYDLWLDGVARTFSLEPGENQLLLDTNGVPAICVQYGEQHLHATSPPYALVHCHLDEWFRRHLASGWWVVDGVAISHGITHDKSTSSHHHLPDVEEPWRERAMKKSKWLESVKEELMQVSCHPSRLQQIGC